METKKLYRSSSNKVFAGVCGGIGEYLNADPVIVRLVWVIATFFSFGVGLFGYLIAYLIIPERNAGGQEKKRYGCLYVLLIIILAGFLISIGSAILGFLGTSFISGVGLISSIGGAYPFSGISGSSTIIMIFMVLSGLVALALIVLVIFLIKSVIKKTNDKE